MNEMFLTVLNMSITGSFVIAAVCLARLLLKKAPKSVSYLLWLVVAFRLLVPFSIESSFSLIPFDTSQPIPQNFTVWQAQAPPPSQHIPSEITASNNDAVHINVVTPAHPAAPVQDIVSQTVQIQWWPTAFAWIWLTGMVAMLIYGAISYYLLSLKMARAGRISKNVYRASNINSPFVLGLFKPKIYLPPHLKSHERDYILLHEQTHISRFDHVVKVMAFVILVLHWFNPLAWVSFILMGKDMEMSCDERVIKKMGGAIKKDYSMTLLSLATGNRIIGAGPLSFGEGGIKERVKNVLNFKKPSHIILVLSLILVIALSVGLSMNRTSGHTAGSETPTSEAGPDNDTTIRGTQYVGAAHETSRIVSYMPPPADGWLVQGIQIGQDHGNTGHGAYTLTVFYEPQDIEAARMMWEIPNQALYANARFLFENIGNLQAITFSVNTGQTGRIDSDIYVYRWVTTREQSATHYQLLNENRWNIHETWTWPHEDINVRHANTISGPIAIIGNRLYVDPVEIIFSNDYDRINELWPNPEERYGLMPNGYYIRHFNVELVFQNNSERLAGLGIDSETAFENDWDAYQHRIPAETLTFEIAPNAIFEFFDTSWILPCTLPNQPGRLTSLENFLLARPHLADESLAGASTFRRIPMYIYLNEDGQVIRVVEEFLLTQ